MVDLEGLACTVVAQLRSRLELLAVEWQEEKLRVGSLLVRIVALLFFLQLTVAMLVLWTVVAWWETPYRVYAIVGVAALALAAAVACARACASRLRRRARVFAGSLAELRKDEQALGRTA